MFESDKKEAMEKHKWKQGQFIRMEEYEEEHNLDMKKYPKKIGWA